MDDCRYCVIGLINVFHPGPGEFPSISPRPFLNPHVSTISILSCAQCIDILYFFSIAFIPDVAQTMFHNSSPVRIRGSQPRICT